MERRLSGVIDESLVCVVLNWKLDGAFSNHVYHLLDTSPPPLPR